MLKKIQWSPPCFNTPFVQKRFYYRMAILQFRKVIPTEDGKQIILKYKIFSFLLFWWKKVPNCHQQSRDWRKQNMPQSLTGQHPKLCISYSEPSHWLMPVFWCCQGNQQRLPGELRQTNQPFQEDTITDERRKEWITAPFNINTRTLKFKPQPANSDYCRARGNQIVEQSSDNETALGSSRKLGGAAAHLIDGKRICRLSFEF